MNRSGLTISLGDRLALAVLLCVIATPTMGGASTSNMAPTDDIPARLSHVTEMAAWRADFVATVGGEPVAVRLTQVGEGVGGSYCWGPCDLDRRDDLAPQVAGGPPPPVQIRGQLAGIATGKTMTLRETPDNDQAQPAEWLLTTANGHIEGVRQTKDGESSMAITFRYAGAAHDFPFELRKKNYSTPDGEEQVDRLMLYRDGVLVQSLKPSGRHTSWPSGAPRIVDVNGDGWPDLQIDFGDDGEPDSPTQTWLYNPASGRMEPGH